MVLMFITVVTWGAVVSGDEGAERSNLEMELTASPVFVGEMPLLRLTLSARGAREVSLLRPDFWSPSHCMVVGLVDPHGRAESMGPPPDIHFAIPVAPFLEITLAAGSSMTASVPTLVWPRVAGQHRLIATLWPHPGRREELRAEVAIEVLPLDEKHVRQQLVFKREGDRREIVSATDEKSVVILFLNPATSVVHRLGMFEAGARVAAHLDESNPAKPRIVVQIREATSAHVLIVDFATGQVLWPRPSATAQELALYAP